MPVVGPRFLIEAGFIVAVAVIAGIERLGTWWIIAVVAAAWVVVALVEIGVWARQVIARQERLAPEPEPVPPPRTSVVVRPERRVLEPRPEPKPEPEPEPEPEPVVAFTPRQAREWNLWELERAARYHTSDDVARNEERAYLLMYLREFAGPDGMLPADFDGLVRDAFGDVLHTVGA